MNIICKSCGADVLISEEQIHSTQFNSQCSFCKTMFTVNPKDSEGHYVVTFSQTQTEQAICVRCSEQFAILSKDVIPLCAKCKREIASADLANANETPSNGENKSFRHSTSSTKTATFASENHSQPVSSIKKKSEASYKQQEPSFGFFSKSAFLAHTSPFIRLYRRYVDFYSLLKIAGIGFLCVSILWIGYRTYTYRNLASSHQMLADFIQTLKSQIPATSDSESKVIAKAAELISRNQRLSYLETVRYLAQGLVQYPSSEEMLALFTEAYSYAAEYGDDSRIQLSALDLANIMIRLYPQRVEGYHAKARVTLMANNVDLAHDTILQAMHVDHENPKTLLIRSKILLRQTESKKTLEQTIELLLQAIQTNPSLLESYDLLGIAYSKMGQPRKAVTAFENRLQHDPHDPLALYQMGKIECRSKEYLSAKGWFEESLRFDPSFVPARIALANLYQYAFNKSEVAKNHYEKILTRYSLNSTSLELFLAKANYAQLCLQSGHINNALGIVAAFPNLLEQLPFVTFTKVYVLRAAGKHKEGMEIINQYNNMYTNDYWGLLISTKMSEQLGYEKESVNVLRKLTKMKPWILHSYVELIRTLTNNAQTEEALEVGIQLLAGAGLMERVDLWNNPDLYDEPVSWTELIGIVSSLVKNHSESPIPYSLFGYALLQRGLDLHQSKDFYGALDYFSKSKQRMKSLDYVYIYMGRTWVELKNWEKAREAFNQALNISPASNVSKYWLGRIYIEQNKTNQAQKILEQITLDEIWGYRALDALGTIQWKLKNSQRAKEFWEQALEKEPGFSAAWRSLLKYS